MLVGYMRVSTDGDRQVLDLQRAPWILLAPSAVIVLTTLCIGVLGDWLRDRLDPTLD